MTLLIDIGNSRLKLGSTLLNTTHAFAHNELDQLVPYIQAQTWPSSSPKKALGVYVASQQLALHTEQLLQRLGCEVQWLDATLPCPLVENGYDQPQRLGADRWLAVIGVLAKQPQPLKRPLIHVSFGTATTVDTVLPPIHPNTSAGRFVGGLILPGVQLMHTSLAANTSQLGLGEGAIEAYPTTTRAAISSGIFAAQMGAVLRQWQLTWQQQLGTPLVVCSGGSWDLLRPAAQKAYASQLQQLHLPTETIISQPTPVLDGLNYIATQTLYK